MLGGILGFIFCCASQCFLISRDLVGANLVLVNLVELSGFAMHVALNSELIWCFLLQLFNMRHAEEERWGGRGMQQQQQRQQRLSVLGPFYNLLIWRFSMQS